MSRLTTIVESPLLVLVVAGLIQRCSVEEPVFQHAGADCIAVELP
jgi:hypothetical protein